MDLQNQRSYRQGLGPRVDALEVAAQALDSDAGAEKIIRMIAESLRTSSAVHGFSAIGQAAQRVETAARPLLPDVTRALIAVLRQELAGQPDAGGAVLLIGDHSPFMDALRRTLETRGLEVLPAGSAAAAQQVLASRAVAFMVLDVMLPDQDGRYLLEVLRSKPLTAAIPVVVIAPKAGSDELERQLVLDDDGYFGKADDPHEVAEFIEARLRHASEGARDPHRDRLTGLLNRAAFCEVYDQALELSVRSGVPVSFALLEVDRLADLEAEQGKAAIELALQRVGLVLASSCRATDRVARWSALQFTVLFPGQDQLGGERAIGKALLLLRRRLPALPDGRTLDLTLSAGVALLAGQTPVEKAVEQADHFLYLAKAHGGNRVVGAGTSMPQRKDAVLIAARDDIAAVFQKILEINGFEVARLRPGSGATSATLAQGHFRLIILEDGDDGGSGFELLRQLRDNPLCHRVPIVVLASDEASAARALDLGANDYMLKPLSPFVFITRVRHLLTRGVPAARQQQHLLLVDADTTALIVAGTVLHKSGGFRIRFARTAADAIRRAAEAAPDAVCAAFALPDMSGVDLIQRLQAMLGAARTAFVFTAPADEVDDAARLGKPHIRGVLTKPFDLQHLVGELSRLLQLKVRSAPPSAEDDAAFNSELQRLLSTPAPAAASSS